MTNPNTYDEKQMVKKGNINCVSNMVKKTLFLFKSFKRNVPKSDFLKSNRFLKKYEFAD
jgi:hypothetical protein